MVLPQDEQTNRRTNRKEDEYDIDNKANRVILVNTSGVEYAASPEQLQSLIETLQELTQRLAVLGAMRGPNDTLRVTGVAMPTTAVSGPITSAQSIAEKNIAGVMFTQRIAIENNTAIQSNIINVVGK